MKSKRVLFGLFVGLIALIPANGMAQSSSNAKLIEIGPDNIGGRVTTLIVDKRDATNNTLYAGTATGGLYIRSNNTDYAEFSSIWNYVDCQIDGVSRTLPISHMIQLKDNSLVIATGEGCFAQGTKFATMASKGVGIVRYNPETGAFSRVESTNPATNDKFANINRLAYAYDGNTLYIYAAAKGGLYRWKIESESDWSRTPTHILDSVEILDVAVVEAYNMVYFSGKKKLYRISSYESNNAVDITTTNSVFTTASRIQLASSIDNPDYLYAMVSDNKGNFKGLYLTKNQNSWLLLTTPTVLPFSREKGATCGAICVDKDNNKHVLIGGSSLWNGHGYTEDALYQWTKSSYNEYEMGSTNFMDDIFSSSYYVHSGINDIVQTELQKEDGSTTQVFYIATNAGVFEADGDFESFININRGLNNVQVNGVAVCTDGSLLIGAAHSANLFIESRMEHHLKGLDNSSSIYNASWYDRNQSGINHLANQYWQGNGGQVAASRYQQYAPESRRNLFFSANDGLYARGYKDFSDYSNTQTWTIGDAFITNESNSGAEVAQMYLWESHTMSGISTITHKIDTLDEIYRRDKGAMMIGTPNTADENSCKGRIKRGDTIIVPNVATASYPIRYVFPADATIEQSGYEITVDNPIQSHLFLRANYVNPDKDANQQKIIMSWTPADFTRIFSLNSEGLPEEPSMGWADVYLLNKKRPQNAHRDLTTFGVSADGDMIYVVVADDQGDSCFVVRIKGMFENIDYHKSRSDIAMALDYEDGPYYHDGSKLVADTLKYNGSIWFHRKISAITFDSRNRAIFTFEGHENEADFANVLLVNNANGNYTFSNDISTPGKTAAYSVLIEASKGDVFVGTEEGLWKSNASNFNNGNPHWERYGDFIGVPVTSIIQQTEALEMQRMTLHDGININNYVFPRTKYPYAIYIGTFGRGVFMDTAFVTDFTNEVVDSTDYYVGIRPVLTSNGMNSVRLYPNPAKVRATMEMTIANSGNAILKVYDLGGKTVVNENLGTLSEGVHSHTIDCSYLPKGMYLVNLIVGNESAAAKLLVR